MAERKDNSTLGFIKEEGLNLAIDVIKILDDYEFPDDEKRRLQTDIVAEIVKKFDTYSFVRKN